MVVPGAVFAHPAGAHVAGGVEAVDLAVDHEGLVGRVGAVRVAVPPAASAPLPRSGCGLGRGSGGDAQARRAHDARDVAGLDAQVCAGGIGGPRDAQARGFPFLLHRAPVLDEGLGAVRVDLGDAQFAPVGHGTAHGGGQGEGCARGTGPRVALIGLVNAGARQRDRGGHVGVQVRLVDALLLQFGLGDVPGGRSLGGGDVDLGVGLEALGGEGVELELGEGRGQDHDLRPLGANGDGRHAFAEEGTLGAPVRGLPVGVVLAVDAAAHDEVGGHAVLACGHRDFAHLAAEFDGVKTGVDHAPGGFH